MYITATRLHRQACLFARSPALQLEKLGLRLGKLLLLACRARAGQAELRLRGAPRLPLALQLQQHLALSLGGGDLLVVLSGTATIRSVRR